MPPPQAKMPVSGRDPANPQAMDRQEGGEVTADWAFEKPVRPATPAVSDRGWPRNPIDAFVLARLGGGRLTAVGRSRSGLAGPSRDPRLLGLLRPREEVDAFVHDRPGRLRAPRGSPARFATLRRTWARRWLDLARMPTRTDTRRTGSALDLAVS